MTEMQKRFKSILIKEKLSVKQFLELVTEVTGETRSRQWLLDIFKTNIRFPDLFGKTLEHLGYNVEWVKTGEGEQSLSLKESILVPMLNIEKIQKAISQMDMQDIEDFKAQLNKVKSLVDSNINLKRILER